MVALTDRKVRFLVIGGHAVAVHGEPRFTTDLDAADLSLRQLRTQET
ncbi:MAG: hypothetical protein M3Y87_02750 [Myxococcota bacterium]|nr:hypothetical protein [Myxococcota bacterium]